MKQRTETGEIVGGSTVKRRLRVVVLFGLFAGAWLGGCDLVLGIDEVSSADGPDGGDRGQRISASTADPEAGRDAAEPTDDAGAD